MKQDCNCSQLCAFPCAHVPSQNAGLLLRLYKVAGPELSLPTLYVWGICLGTRQSGNTRFQAPRSSEHVMSPEGRALWCAHAVLAVPGARMVPAPEPCAFQGLCLILILIHEFVLEDFLMFLCFSLEAFIG